MKITKRELRQMINESVYDVLNEGSFSEFEKEFDDRLGERGLGFKKCELSGGIEDIIQRMPLNSYDILERNYDEKILIIKCKETGKEMGGNSNIWDRHSIERSRIDPSLSVRKLR